MQALDLRVKGLSLRAIAAELGLASPQSAANLIDGALEDRVVPHVDKLREVHGERLEADFVRLGEVVDHLFPKVIAGHAMSADVVIKALSARANVVVQLTKLFGTQAKEQVDVSGVIALSATANEQLLDRLNRLAATAREGEARPEPDADGGAGDPPHVEDLGTA